ncbi:MAG: DUF5996 family protein [Candidatus Eremiobacteraeota bacterium]|nr:DUF5996 family protein [Candidatus Eremiobacteraeota bacterium]
MGNDAHWPELPLAAWRATCDTLHMYAQIVGKIRLALSPAEPEWAHTALYVTSRGLTTGPIPFADRSFQIDFDFVEHRVDIVDSDGASHCISLVPSQSVATFYREIMDALQTMHVNVHLWPMAVEVPNPIRLDTDTTHASYDPQSANRFFHVLVQADAALKAHRAPFRRRHTLVQFFFGSFDLAYARYSGRPATPPSNEVIMRDAMDAEEICVGFWPGDDRFPEPAFWCYAYPKPAGAEALPVLPAAASWNDKLGEFVLRYEDVRTAASPREALREFFSSTYDGLSKLARWNEAGS